MASFDKRVLKFVPEPAMARLAPAALGFRCLGSADRRDAIRGALAATGGNRVAAAKLLRISRATLYEKLARYPELARG